MIRSAVSNTAAISKSIKTTIFYASEVAACIGKHPFHNRDDAIAKVWHRNDKPGYKAAMQRNSIEISDLRSTVSNIVASNEEEEIITQILNDATTATPDELKQQLQALSDLPCMIAHPKILQTIISEVFSARGTSQEASSLQMFTQRTRTQIRKDLHTHKVEIPYNNDKKLAIYGRIDGLTESGDLIEIKNRQRRLFNYVPKYEIIQVHVYMYMIKKKSCVHIQVYNGEMKKANVIFDEDLWNEIQQLLIVAADQVQSIICSIDQQDKLLHNVFS
jgi:hypothetical protein